jgi:uncharacterized membrane protein SirB2
MYSTIKTIHVTCAIISITGFSIRGILKLCESSILNQRWIKISPHVVDTLLLLSAIYLATASHQYPVQHAWLSAKVIALLVYIGMGFVVMRTAKNKTQQVFAFFAALLSAGYIVAVALTRSPLPF